MTTEPQRRQTIRQLDLSEMERKRLWSRIWEDFEGAQSAHETRVAKFRRIFRMWRGLEDPHSGNRQDGPDFPYPMLKWITRGQWARIMQGILGDDAEIVARASAPSNDSDAVKAGHYMTWRLFEYMAAAVPLSVWVFRALLWGRGHAEVLYEHDYYWERDQQSGEDREVLCYDGPRIRPLWPSQLILPAQDNVFTVDDFDWVIRTDRMTPQQLLDGERRGHFQGIRDNWRTIVSQASAGEERDYQWDGELQDADEAEGVDHGPRTGNRNSVRVWRWYGKWRLPKGKRDARADNLELRMDDESELLITCLPDCQMLIGVQDRRDLYPRSKKRHPFLDLGTIKDGSYWTPGLGELIDELQDESSKNYMLFRKAGMLTVGPVIFYKPSSNFDPDTFEYRPGQAIPTENPEGVRVIELRANLQFCEVMQQTLNTLGEKVTGVTDFALGRAPNAPNAPRTASGQAMLIEEGNILVSLDLQMIRADLALVLDWVWQLDREYSDEEVFFRVTDEDAGALFGADRGFGKMTAEEREQPFGFDLTFATSVWSRESKKQGLLQIYGLAMQNPIVATNPRALWVLLNRIWEAFGERNFRDVIPEPPQPEMPHSPKEEWSMMLKGEEVEVNPIDDDMQHLIDHRRRLEDTMNDLPERRDYKMEEGAVRHIVGHEQQRRQKMLLQQLAQQAVEAMAAQGINLPALAGVEQGAPGAAQPGGPNGLAGGLPGAAPAGPTAGVPVKPPSTGAVLA